MTNECDGNKTCENCAFMSSYVSPSFKDGHHDGWNKHMTCNNKQSSHWCREVNNLITCNYWRTN